MQTEQPRHHPVWSPGFSRLNVPSCHRGKSRLIAVNRAKKNFFADSRTVAVLSVRPATRPYAPLRALKYLTPFLRVPPVLWFALHCAAKVRSPLGVRGNG